ncbi:hypothetical protein QJS04_geneDACA000906 [Acorus gramineus]|uniref:Uncharacterized protein n=1 Tax=Acorus gramineus TaxID=55184 RepID=A0AAV9AFH9_ACOGR|nr:hypothetical protein QJS04_geneDACA000906 [Acorus gramineus]
MNPPHGKVGRSLNSVYYSIVKYYYSIITPVVWGSDTYVIHDERGRPFPYVTCDATN